MIPILHLSISNDLDRQKYLLITQGFMDNYDSKRTMDTIELNPFLGLPMSIFPRYPPGVLPPTIALMNQKRLKEKFFQENASMTTKLQDYILLYKNHLKELFGQKPNGNTMTEKQENYIQFIHMLVKL